MGFRKDFLWGVATAAFQIEGAAAEDGRGESVWDVFTHEKGRIRGGNTADVACDHYHRYKEDVQLMSELGTKVYRFSVSWSRIFPDGTGKVNQKGIDFYNNLIDELVSAGITPCVTLFHWDYPEALEMRGGWLNPDSPEWFRQYTETVVKAFGDRVKYYCTFNEPQCFVGAYTDGGSAPGQKLPTRYVIRIMHNVFLAHGLAVMEIRKHVKNSVVGYVPTCGVNIPLTDSPEDVAAAKEHYFDIDPEWWVWNVILWSDPIVLGHYPEDNKFFKSVRQYLPEDYKNDLKTICQPLDFYGQNIYNGSLWSRGEDGKPKWHENPAGIEHTSCGWPVTPDALYWGPRFLYERYKLPIIICENGISCTDAVALDGSVHDAQRIDFTHRYLKSLMRAADEGVDIAGYFHWSILDNFEWCSGYAERFGLVYVDYQTGKRTKKDSFEWYKNVIATNGENL